MGKREVFLGVDVGSVSINVVAVNDKNDVIEKIYMRTEGKPIQILKEAMGRMSSLLPADVKINGVGQQAAAGIWQLPFLEPTL